MTWYSLKSLSSHRAALFLVALAVVGCNEPFGPKGPFVQRFVAYAVLDARADTQYVRLYLNYNPPNYDPHAVPGEQYDTTAVVTISSTSQNYVFHDTLLPSSIHAFVNRTFRPQPGSSYSLSATSSRGAISAETQIPGSGSLAVQNQSTLLFPSSFPTGNVEVQGILATSTRGFLVRFIFVYSLASDSTVRHEIEIPMSYEQNSAGASAPVYPQLQRNTGPNPIIDFPVSSFLQVIADLTDLNATRVLMKQAKFYLVQVDEPLYNYYNVANGFQDKFSIRTDQPDYTNIQNGYGVFGSFNVDSLIIHY